ncbi:multidrug effflux MFS transporter [uncultured Enterovirga sp.]|uniref:multidrug effflux MFS transporter n=1 Tax=uncultured Enterovirga sp. TaxID=2026352 RepID=UPI0035CBFEA8
MSSDRERPATAGRSAPSLALLIAVTMTGTVALHIFIPALPAAARDLGTSPAAIQLTITLYLIGLAVGQLIYGPISDRLGRRPVIIASLALYLAGIVLAIPAATIGWLVAARVLQSVGACGALVLGRAMVRDVSTNEDAAKKLAVLIACMTLTPSLAPGIGGLIETWFGWRAIFVALAAVVGALTLIVVLTLPETHPPSGAESGINSAFSGYRRLMRSAKFRRYTLAGSCAGTSLYAFLSVAPFLYIDVLHRSGQEVGLYCVIVSLGMAAGAAMVRFMVGRMEIRRGARLGNLVSFAGAALLLAAHLSGELSVATLTGTMLLYALGIGIGGPNMVAGAMGVDPEAAGSASGLYGFSQMAVGALATLAVGLWHDGSALPLAVVLIMASLTTALMLQRV